MTQEEKLNLLNTMNEAAEYLKDHPEDVYLLDNFNEALEAFGVNAERNLRTIIEPAKSDMEKLNQFLTLYQKWERREVRLISASYLPDYREGVLGCDRTFQETIQFIETHSESQLVKYVTNCLDKIRHTNPGFYQQLTVGYRGWYFPGNWLDGIGGKNNSLITNRVRAMKKNVELLKWLYQSFMDAKSRECLNAILLNWLTFSMEAHDKAADYKGNLVCDPDIFPGEKGEVFVDCGAYIGDTALEYVNVYNQEFARIYVYDINEVSIQTMRKTLKHLEHVVFNMKGVSDKKGKLTFKGVDNMPFHGNHLVDDHEEGGVDVVALDEDIQEDIGFLKIDVEGLDKEAINGAKGHILRTHPRIVVDSYHKLEDIVKVPELIHSLDSTYRFYLRCHQSLKDPIGFATNYAIFAV